MNCTNCGAKLSCGCQKRVATDGKHVCSSCIAVYESGLKKISTTKSSPSNVKVFYTPPKK